MELGVTFLLSSSLKQFNWKISIFWWQRFLHCPCNRFLSFYGFYFLVCPSLPYLIKFQRGCFKFSDGYMSCNLIDSSFADALGATLANHLDKPRLYIGCMKSGEVFSEPWAPYLVQTLKRHLLYEEFILWFSYWCLWIMAGTINGMNQSGGNLVTKNRKPRNQLFHLIEQLH